MSQSGEGDESCCAAWSATYIDHQDVATHRSSGDTESGTKRPVASKYSTSASAPQPSSSRAADCRADLSSRATSSPITLTPEPVAARAAASCSTAVCPPKSCAVESPSIKTLIRGGSLEESRRVSGSHLRRRNS